MSLFKGNSCEEFRPKPFEVGLLALSPCGADVVAVVFVFACLDWPITCELHVACTTVPAKFL